MGKDRRKVRHISAGEGMTIVAKSMGSSIDSLKDIINGASQAASSSHLKIESQAIEAIENDEGFDSEKLTYTVMAITDKSGSANAYLSLKSQKGRSNYICGLMKNL